VSDLELEDSDCFLGQCFDTPARAPVRLKFGLSTGLLIVAVIAAGMGNWQVDRKLAPLKRQMPGLIEADRELVVDDPSKFAVVKRNEQWAGECIFDVHLPEGSAWRLCLALEEVGEEGLADPAGKSLLSPGRHSVEVRYDFEKSTVSVLVDGSVAIKEANGGGWNYRGAAMFRSSSQQHTTEPLVLYRKRFLRWFRGKSWLPNRPAGVLVWIEKVEAL